MKLAQTLRMFGIVAAFLGTAATQSFALPANEVETEYFSDATFTREVGYSFLACQGGFYREGKQTRYAVRSLTPCHSPGPIEVECLVDNRETWCPANICDSGLFDCQ
jgi:Family of unknown function (DUF6289)